METTGIVIAEMRRRKDFCLGEDAGAKVFLLLNEKEYVLYEENSGAQ